MFKIIVYTLVTLNLSSCFLIESNLSTRSSENAINSNSPASLSNGYGRIWEDNPIILTGNDTLSPTYDISSLISYQKYITDNQFLIRDCAPSYGNYIIRDCMKVTADKNSDPVPSINETWGYAPDTSEFLQAHTYWHTSNLMDNIFNIFENIHMTASSSFFYNSAIPTGLFSQSAFWDPNKTLNVYADSDTEDNSYFAPATFSLHYGHDSIYKKMNWAEDPSIIYHETGHVFTQVMLNIRNRAANILEQSNLGYAYYDEAGSIGEGISDYYSYMSNGRSRFSEWALGRFQGLARPITEEDSLHAPGITTDSASRLKYPEYINYNPNYLDQNPYEEDVHYSGMIASHYFVALTVDLMDKCGFDNKTAMDYIIYFLTETLGELGDLTGLASDQNILGTDFPVNLNNSNASTWLRLANPINYRSFFQKFGKYIYLILNNNKTATTCGGSYYEKDYIEQLLDNYGLLLFDSYNENGNGINNGNSNNFTTVTQSNRMQTVLIAKDLIDYPPDKNTTQAYVFDNRTDMRSTLANLTSLGIITDLSSQTEADLPYNNGNSRISPGEFVGIMLNLYNHGNYPMAGIQVLANDWDHTKDRRPCNTFEDNFPTIANGAADSSTELINSVTPGDCNYITRNNGDAIDPLAPICFIQQNDNNETRWVGQDEFREHISLEEKNCLGGVGNTNDCFIRSVAGANQSFFSKIDAKSTWGKTLAPDKSPIFHSSNVIFFEVSKWIPPGTSIDCRFRVRFSNCKDCYVDPLTAESDPTYFDDYRDFEYSGGKPFKILHFNFIVID